MKVQEPNFSNNLKSFQLKLISRLFAERQEGSWQGQLSSSALSTAVGIFALAQYDEDAFIIEIKSGLNWLVRSINNDGSYGDTVESPGNISTTLLCWAAFSLSSRFGRQDKATIDQIEKWLIKEAGSLESKDIIAKVLENYGDDHTFSVPILTMCTLAGCFREDDRVWQQLPQLPFELSVLPPSLFKFLKLDVVSYALPALITIGLVRFKHAGAMWNPLNWLRKLLTSRALRKLKAIQPANGGFLEASPLTGFVLMSLVGSGQRDLDVAAKCASFLRNSQRTDGSLPIDTHLHTWVTTLAVNALTENDNATWLDKYGKREALAFLLNQQHNEIHPYTNAAAGGWAWSPLPGAVPDADDTAGALLALRRLTNKHSLPKDEAISGIRWLIGLQNKDGGIPTFCRGWGKLPFDKSCPDITAHAIRAMLEWNVDLPDLAKEIDRSIRRMVKYLADVQQENGSWLPLWFGNQHTENQANPTYGTAQVVIALNECLLAEYEFTEMLKKGEAWLLSAQNEQGAWGGDIEGQASIEETALAVNALVSSGKYEQQAENGLQALMTLTEGGGHLPASPIGLYFASLWYDEKMYPLVYSLAAVEKYFARLGHS